jgi:hypothetical protein
MTATNGVATSTIRAWARANGYTVGDRGRLSKALILAFHEAHPAG